MNPQNAKDLQLVQSSMDKIQKGDYLTPGHRSAVTLGLVAVAILISALSAHATAYYAATNGSDSSPGTEAQPFQTIDKGVSVLKPGDTLFLRAGAYVSSSGLANRIPSGNSWLEPVTIKNQPGETPVIATTPSQHLFYFANGNHHIVIDGMILDAAGGQDGVKIGSPSHHIRISNSEIKNAGGQGISVQDTGTDFNEFINLHVHHNGGTNTQFNHGFYIATQNNVIDGCLIDHNAGYGIQIYGGKTDPNDNIVRNSIVRDHAAKPAIVVNGDRNQVYNNVLFHNQGGVEFLGGNANGKVYNNTIFGNNGPGIQGPSPVTVNQKIQNNIVYQNNPNIASTGTGAVLSNNLMTDPGFVNVGSLDFHIQQNSAARSAGLNLYAEGITTDIYGAPRPQSGPYDIGAYQFIGAGDSTPPPAPQGVRILP